MKMLSETDYNDLHAQIQAQAAEIEQINDLVARLKQEAQCHAQEARTQRGTVLAIYQAFGTQKGDWNGATPVIEAFTMVQQERDHLALANDQLKAQQLKMREFLIWCKSEGATERDFDLALQETPAQSLAEIQAQAVDGAANALFLDKGSAYDDDIIFLEHYANQLRNKTETDK